MSDKRCPYCGGLINEGFCTHCGAVVPPEKQVDPSSAPEMPPIHEPSYSRYSYGDEPVPWERMDELGFWTALSETVKEVLGTPEDFFSRLSPSGGIGKPLLYGVILGVIGVIFGQIWVMLADAIGLSASGMMGGGFSDAMTQHSTGLLAGIMNILMSVVAIPIGLFFLSGVLHLMLMILGGADEGFEATFRAVCFAQTAQIVQIIPIIGSFAAAIWIIILQVKALANLHDITPGKALLAIFLPAIVCCFLLVPFVCMMGGLAGMAAG